MPTKLFLHSILSPGFPELGRMVDPLILRTPKAWVYANRFVSLHAIVFAPAAPSIRRSRRSHRLRSRHQRRASGASAGLPRFTTPSPGEWTGDSRTQGLYEMRQEIYTAPLTTVALTASTSSFPPSPLVAWSSNLIRAGRRQCYISSSWGMEQTPLRV